MGPPVQQGWHSVTSQLFLNAGKKRREESWAVFVLSVTVGCLRLHGSADPRCPPGQRELLYLQEDGGNASNMIWCEYSTPHTTRKPPSTLPASWLRGGGGRRRGQGGGGRRRGENFLGCLTMALIYRKTTRTSQSPPVLHCGTKTIPVTSSMTCSGLEIWEWTYVT